MSYPKPCDEDGRAVGACMDDRHPQDNMLRRHGYSIWARPKTGPVIWMGPDGKLYVHRHAVEKVKEDIYRVEQGR